MKHITRIFSALFLTFILAFSAQASEQTSSAKQVYIVDMMTGSIIFEKNADEKMPTSSMSKVMTMYAVFDAIKKGRLSLNDEIEVSEKAWRKGGSKMFIEVGKKVKVEDLIKGVIVQSGNDAAIALAEGLAGSEDNFAMSLNNIAQELGMKNSHFKNASGWPDPDHYSTARDLGILAQYLIVNFPEFYHYYAIQEFEYNNIKQNNRNPLLYRKMGVDGIKTGHTEVAGYGLMASGMRDGRRVVMVVNGLESEKARAQEGARLMEWALANFENQKAFSKGQEIARTAVKLGTTDTVPLVIGSDVKLTLPKARKNEVKIEASYTTPLKAPVKAGQKVGELKIAIPGQAEKTFPLYTAADVPEASFVTKAFENLILMIQNS
jgi:D-alanyl-D-alanine carboxypeptidase (penicillin-binding protein 5/6)